MPTKYIRKGKKVCLIDQILIVRTNLLNSCYLNQWFEIPKAYSLRHKGLVLVKKTGLFEPLRLSSTTSLNLKQFSSITFKVLKNK